MKLKILLILCAILFVSCAQSRSFSSNTLGVIEKGMKKSEVIEAIDNYSKSSTSIYKSFQIKGEDSEMFYVDIYIIGVASGGMSGLYNYAVLIYNSEYEMQNWGTLEFLQKSENSKIRYIANEVAKKILSNIHSN